MKGTSRTPGIFGHYQWLVQVGLEGGAAVILRNSETGSGVRDMKEVAAWMHPKTRNPKLLALEPRNP